MKEFTVFLACAAKLEGRQGDCDWERERFTSLVEKLSQEEYEKYGIKIIPFQSEDGAASGKDGKQEEYNQQIRNSFLCFVLIGKYAGKFTEDEYDVANKARKENDRPKICVLFRNSKDSEADVSVERFYNKVWNDVDAEGGKKQSQRIYSQEYTDKSAFEKTVRNNIRSALAPELEEAVKRYQEEKAKKEAKRKRETRKLVLFGILSLILMFAEYTFMTKYPASIPPKEIYVSVKDMEAVENDKVDRILNTLNGTGKGMIEDAQSLPSGKAGYLGDEIKKITIDPGKPFPLYVSQEPGEIFVIPEIAGIKGVMLSIPALDNLQPNTSNTDAVQVKLENKQIFITTPENWSEGNGSGSIIIFKRNGVCSTPIYIAVQSPMFVAPDFSIISNDEKKEMGWN